MSESWTYEREDAQLAMAAILRASGRVRDGRWINGAPSHVLAELLTQLSTEGWHLRHDRQLQALDARSQALHDLITEAAEWAEAEADREHLTPRAEPSLTDSARAIAAGDAYRACASYLSSRLSGEGE